MPRSEEHTSELQSRPHLVCRLLLEKKKNDEHREQRQNLSTAARLTEDRAVGRLAADPRVVFPPSFLRQLQVEKVCIAFFFNDTATTEIYTLSLHDALPI